MGIGYDKYYQKENLFGKPYPQLLNFFSKYPNKGKVLDLGCGQGRDAIPLARLGYEVLGVDQSKVGLDQMNQIAAAEKLNLNCKVQDIFLFDSFEEFDFVLLDSMFHFAKKDFDKEAAFLQRLFSKVNTACIIVICIQDTGKKVEYLTELIEENSSIVMQENKQFNYTFEDSETGHQSNSPYRMIAVQKQY